MDNQLTIPDTVRVGFQNRSDTYTAKLAFVVFRENKGKLRKENAWEGWRDKKIPAVDLPNEPTEGFVLNRDVGGARRSYGWNARIEKVRCFDPRNDGFEFEISIPNLLFILRECDCSKGKGLEGKFVYAWSGQELILLPTHCQEYKSSKEFTQLQTQGVKAKELIPGATYQTKKQKSLVYLGRFDVHNAKYVGPSWYWHRRDKLPPISKQYVFWDGKNFDFHETPKQLARLTSDAVVTNFAELTDAFAKSMYGSKVVALKTKSSKRRKKDGSFIVEDTPGTFLECSVDYNNDRTEIDYVSVDTRIKLKDGQLSIERVQFYSYPNDGLRKRFQQGGYGGYYYGRHDKSSDYGKWLEPNNARLYAVMESGSEFEYRDYGLVDPNMKEEDEDGEDENY